MITCINILWGFFFRKYSQLRINKASSEDAGVYTCIATNVVGTTEKSVKIKGKTSFH